MGVGSVRTAAGMAIMAGASGMVTAKADTARGSDDLIRAHHPSMFQRVCTTSRAVAWYQFVFFARSALIGAKLIISE